MKSAERVDAVVIGAGVVGLAVARALARVGRDVIVCEARNAYGTLTSARNSEVLHAGLHYPSDWLKTQLCVQGRPMVEQFASQHGVPWRRLGKLVVATGPAELPALDKLHQRALQNGATEVTRISGDEARRLEPALAPRTAGALLSPETGIIDSHSLMRALLGDAQDHGAWLALKSPVSALQSTSKGLRVSVASDPPVELLATVVVNAAGHHAPLLARGMTALPETLVPQASVCKGNYFALAGKAPFSRLIYPLATAAGLGVHLTLDMGGQARFGPDTQWIEAHEASWGHAPHAVEVDSRRALGFEQAVKQFWPGLAEGSLHPAFAGLRPKVHDASQPLADFIVQGEDAHGVPGLVNLFGIESPGLTSCMALASHVLQKLALPASTR